MHISYITQLIYLAFVSLATAEDLVCGPFQLTSTNGELYETEDGIQFPGPSFVALNGSIFDFFPQNGSLYNLAGYPCTFDPYFTCRKSNAPATAQCYNLSSSFGEMSYNSNSSFYVCPPIAVKNESLSLQTSTMTVSATTQPFPGFTDLPPVPPVATVPLRYIFDDRAVGYLDIGTDGLNESQCLWIGIQGSGCTGSSLATSSGHTTIVYVSSSESISQPTTGSGYSTTASNTASVSTNRPSASSTSLVASPTSTSGSEAASNCQVLVALLFGPAIILASEHLF